MPAERLGADEDHGDGVECANPDAVKAALTIVRASYKEMFEKHQEL